MNEENDKYAELLEIYAKIIRSRQNSLSKYERQLICLADKYFNDGKSELEGKNYDNEEYAKLLEFYAETIKTRKTPLTEYEKGIIESLGRDIHDGKPKNNLSGTAKMVRRYGLPYRDVPPERRPTDESIKEMGIGLQSHIEAKRHPIEWNPDVLDY